jgi:hypothetical protein
MSDKNKKQCHSPGFKEDIQNGTFKVLDNPALETLRLTTVSLNRKPSVAKIIDIWSLEKASS